MSSARGGSVDRCSTVSLSSRLRDVMRMSSLGATSAQPAVTTAGGDLMRGFSSLSNRVSFAAREGQDTAT